jgi:CRISPR-associated protein Cas4
MLVSVTSLSSYTFCPRKLYLEQVLKLVKPPKKALVLGSIRHEFHDKINKAEPDIVKSISIADGLEDIVFLYKREYYKILKQSILGYKESLKEVGQGMNETFRYTWVQVTAESKVRAMNIFSFKSSTGMFGESLWNELTPKISSEVRVESSKIMLKGIVDHLEIHKDGGLVPIELKTGKAPQEGVWQGHKYQLGSYILLLEEKYQRTVERGMIRYLEIAESRDVSMNPFLRDEIFSLRDKVIDLLQSKDIPPIIKEKNKCAACELRPQCYSL